jgi:hypothetical protein
MATLLYVRSGGLGQAWHIIRHPPRRGDPIWDRRIALCGEEGQGTPWHRHAGWYEHHFGPTGSPQGPICPLCQAEVAVPGHETGR